MSFMKKIGREVERTVERFGKGTKRVFESTIEETNRFAGTDIGKITLTAAAAAAGFGGAALLGVPFASTALAAGGIAAGAAGTALTAKDIIDKQTAAKKAAGLVGQGQLLEPTGGGLLEPLSPAESPSGVIDLKPPPESLSPDQDPGSISIKLGTSTERRRRKSSRRRRGGTKFGGAGLLVPRADVQRQTLGGF